MGSKRVSPRRPSLAEKIGSGDQRAALEALRDELVRRMPMAPDREAIGLATQLRLILAELSALDTGPEETDVVDEIAARRARRRADAADSGGAAEGE